MSKTGQNTSTKSSTDIKSTTKRPIIRNIRLSNRTSAISTRDGNNSQEFKTPFTSETDHPPGTSRSCGNTSSATSTPSKGNYNESVENLLSSSGARFTGNKEKPLQRARSSDSETAYHSPHT